MKRLRLSRRGLVVGATVCCGLLLCYFQMRMVRINAALSSRRLPGLPAGVRGEHFWAGGVFAKYMNVKFTASVDQALDYLRRAGAQSYDEFQIVDEGDRIDYRIVATHPLASTPGACDNKGLILLLVRGFSAKPWFRSVYNIRRGWYYSSEEPIERYYMFYDLDSQQFYIYWRYS